MADQARRSWAFSWRAASAVIASLAVGTTLAPWMGAARADTLRQAPNSRIAMEVAENFKASDRFSGFVDEKSGASFLIVEMPALAYDEVKRIADRPEALAQKGVVDTKKTDLPGRGGEYVYLTGKQKTLAGDFGKYILVMRDNGVTAMITANIPQRALDAKTVTQQQVERAFISAMVKAEAVKGQELFRLSYLGPFKETISVLGTSKAYNLTGQIPEMGKAKPTLEPIFVVSPSVDKTQLLDLKSAAQNSFRSIGGLSAHAVQSEKDVTIGGLKGYEIVGEGKDAKTGTQAGVYIVLLSGEAGGYYILAGTAPAAEMPNYLSEFQKIATGFEPKTVQ